MACDKITIGGNNNCPLPRGGTRPRAIAFNFDEVLDHTEDSEGRILSIVLAPGATGHVFTGFRNDAKKSDEVVDPGVGPFQFKHNCGWIIYERTQEQKNNAEALAKGRFVVIIENKGKDDDAVEVLGIGVGVRLVAGVIRDAHANGGFFVLSFATPTEDHEFEGKLPQSLGTGYANAQTIIDSLIPEESS